MDQTAQPVRVVFQGDSVTDCMRGRFNDGDLGDGYVMMAAASFAAQFPERRVQFFNRGNSGDRVRDLRARWEEDCLELRPDWVSLLVGINDTWRRYDENDLTPVAAFEAEYRAILEATVAQGARLILCEPFVLPVMPEQMAWREDLDPKIGVIRQLAREYRARLIPLDGLFAQVAMLREPAFWADDGVHPTHAGHALIARAWLETFTRALGHLSS